MSPAPATSSTCADYLPQLRALRDQFADFGKSTENLIDRARIRDLTRQFDRLLSQISADAARDDVQWSPTPPATSSG